MKRAEGKEFQAIKPFFAMAAATAKEATCRRAKCGSVIISNDTIIGKGFNSPVLGDETQRLCDAVMNTSLKPKYDKTCCVHAEWRAVLDASKNHANSLRGSTLYFMRIDDDGKFTNAGQPYCTTCSRLTMEAGVTEFALYNNEGADIYSLDEYNQKSYENYIT